MSPKKITRPAAEPSVVEPVENVPVETAEAAEESIALESSDVVEVSKARDTEAHDAEVKDTVASDVMESDVTDKDTADNEPAEAVDDDVPTARPRSRTPAGRARRIGGAPTSLTTTEPTATTRASRIDSGDAKRDVGASAADDTSSTPQSAVASTRPHTGTKFTGGRVVAAIAAVVIVGLALANVLVWHPWHKDDSSRDTALIQRILSTAKQSTAPVISYDYRNWDKSVSAAVGGLAGQFKKDYTTAMASYKDKAVTAQAVTVAQVDNAGLVSINSKGSEATVAVYVERTVTNTSNTTARQDLLAVTEILDHINGQWKITKLSFIN